MLTCLGYYAKTLFLITCDLSVEAFKWWSSKLNKVLRSADRFK